ncbi:hypothetical protein [Hymenobacter tenuis]
MEISLMLVCTVPVLVLFISAGLVAGLMSVVWEAKNKLVGFCQHLLGQMPIALEPVAPPEVEELFHNEFVHLWLENLDEDGLDQEFTNWREQWDELEFQGHSPLTGRLLTKPEVVGLHGQLASTLCREGANGVFMQLLEPLPGQVPPATSWLVHLEFASLKWQCLAETKEFYLLPNETADPSIFKGVNTYSGEVEIQVETLA